MTIRAAIDIGSSSVKLLVLELRADVAYCVLAEQARVTGLGKGVGEAGCIGPAALRATLDCLHEMVDTAHAMGAADIRAAGTDALRRAANRAELLDAALDELGLRIEVLSGDEEARISRAVALRELPPEAADAVFFDVGGGSTELTLCQSRRLISAQSLGLGARRCTELAQVAQPVTAAQHRRLSELVQRELEAHAPRCAAGPVTLAGLGGTASQLVYVLRGLHGAAKGAAHGARVTAGEIHAVLEQLAGMTLAQVQGLKYMDPARGEIIYAGISIIAELLRFYTAEDFMLIDRGLRYGLLLA